MTPVYTVDALLLAPRWRPDTDETVLYLFVIMSIGNDAPFCLQKNQICSDCHDGVAA